MENPLILCACGCGEQISKYGSQGRKKRYLKNHDKKVSQSRHFSEEQKMKIIELYTKERLTKRNIATRFNCAESTIGIRLKNWGIKNIDKTLNREEVEAVIDLYKKGEKVINLSTRFRRSPVFLYNLIKREGETIKEHHHNKETKMKIRIANMGKKLSKETKDKLSLINKGKVLTIPHKKKISEALTGRKQSPDLIRKRLIKRTKSSLELKFEGLIRKLNLPYRFVGNGQIIIARKVPDFINTNGKKIAVEVFYRKHKSMFRGNIEEWKADRVRIFNSEGWEVIFFDETQVNEEKIKELLGSKKNE